MAENEDADDLAIIFRSAGKPVRMSSAAKWRRAITLGDLTRQTPVEVEAAGRSLGVRPAGEVPALARLFDEISPLAADSQPEPASDADVAEATVPVVAAVEAAPAPAADPASPSPPVEPRPATVPPAAPTTKKSNPAGCLGVVAVIIILAIVTERGCERRHAAASSAAAQTVYVTRQVNLRPDPSSANAPSGALDRGAALTGVWNDADKTWFKITSGDHVGSYVWGMDLAERQRPDLAEALSATRITLRGVTEYREPETGSPSVREVAAGESLVVAGKLASGWWEVMNKGKTASTVAGVGYVPPEAFDGPIAAPPGATPTVPAAGALSVNGCNQSGRPLSVAYAFLPPGGGSLWKYKGWTRLAAGECKLLFLTDTADFYLRAETDDDGARLAWGGDVNRCVAYPGPYEYDLELSGSCPFDSKAAGFYRRTPDNASGRFTETFR